MLPLQVSFQQYAKVSKLRRRGIAIGPNDYAEVQYHMLKLEYLTNARNHLNQVQDTALCPISPTLCRHHCPLASVPSVWTNQRCPGRRELCLSLELYKAAFVASQSMGTSANHLGDSICVFSFPDDVRYIWLTGVCRTFLKGHCSPPSRLRQY